MEYSDKLFDSIHLEELSGGDTSFELEIVETFLECAPDLITATKESLGSGQTEAATRSLHTLKGSALSVGASRFGKCCAELESALKHGESIDPNVLDLQLKDFSEAVKAHYDEAA